MLFLLIVWNTRHFYELVLLMFEWYILNIRHLIQVRVESWSFKWMRALVKRKKLYIEALNADLHACSKAAQCTPLWHQSFSSLIQRGNVSNFKCSICAGFLQRRAVTLQNLLFGKTNPVQQGASYGTHVLYLLFDLSFLTRGKLPAKFSDQLKTRDFSKEETRIWWQQLWWRQQPCAKPCFLDIRVGSPDIVLMFRPLQEKGNLSYRFQC